MYISLNGYAHKEKGGGGVCETFWLKKGKKFDHLGKEIRPHKGENVDHFGEEIRPKTHKRKKFDNER